MRSSQLAAAILPSLLFALLAGACAAPRPPAPEAAISPEREETGEARQPVFYLYCRALADEMTRMFSLQYKGLGARVSL